MNLIAGAVRLWSSLTGWDHHIASNTPASVPPTSSRRRQRLDSVFAISDWDRHSPVRALRDEGTD